MATWYYLTKLMKRKHSSRNFQKLYEKLPNHVEEANRDLKNRCRVCLRKGSVNIFNSDKSNDIIDFIEKLGDILITCDDSFSKLLCEHCLSFIEAAILFKKAAKRTHELLLQHWPSPKEETLEDNEQDSNHSYSDIDHSETKPSAASYTHSPVLEVNVVKLKKEKKDKTKFSPKVTCHICNKVINRSYYKEHITMHDPDHNKYVCDVCGKSFRLRCAYHNHSLRHRNDFPYKCTFCPYRGRYAELLKTHMRTHTGDYRYMCTECPARFLFKSNLNSHMLKHKEPQHKCDTCKRAFHTTLALQRHFEADHLGIKNHVCNICGKAFGYRNAMMKHQRHVHKREKLLFGRMPSYLEAEKKQNT